MTQPMASPSTNVNTRTYGHYTLVARITPDGGYSLAVFVGATLYGGLGLVTADRNTYRARYALVRDAAKAGKRPDEIADLIHGPARQVLAQAAEVLDQVGLTTAATR